MNVVRKKKLSELQPLCFCLLVMGTAWVVVAGVTPKANAETFIVTTVEDGSVNDVGTFRWAVNQANINTNEDEDEVDTIEFDQALESFADSLRVIEIKVTSAPLVIESELMIQGFTTLGTGPMMEDEAFFISVRVDPDLETFFEVQENITLVNATLQANSIVFNGGTPDGGQPRDLIYEIDNFRTDITWRILDQSTEVPKDGDGRLIKRGTGELGLFPDATSYSGGTLLENGVIRTDAAGLGGDIQICSNDAADTDANCGDT